MPLTLENNTGLQEAGPEYRPFKMNDTNEIVGVPAHLSDQEVETFFATQRQAQDQGTENAKLLADNPDVAAVLPDYYKQNFETPLKALSAKDMAQPNFIYDNIENRARAFDTSLNGFFGVRNKGFEGEQDVEAAKKYPGAALLGGLTAQLPVIMASFGLGDAIGVGKLATMVGNEFKAPLARKAITALVDTALKGGIFGGVSEGTRQAVEGHPDLDKLGHAILENAVMFAPYSVGGLIPSRPVGTAAIAGLTYLLGKIGGVPEEDNLLNSIALGALHAVSSGGDHRESLQAVREAQTAYVQSKNHIVDRNVAADVVDTHLAELSARIIDQIKTEEPTPELPKDLKPADNLARDAEGKAIEVNVPRGPESFATAEEYVASKNKDIEIYRGENTSSENKGKGGVGYHTVDKDFASQFTQTGQASEVKARKINSGFVYDAREHGGELPSANNEVSFDKGMADAKAKGYSAFRLSEGKGEPESIYVFDKKALHPQTYGLEPSNKSQLTAEWEAAHGRPPAEIVASSPDLTKKFISKIVEEATGVKEEAKAAEIKEPWQIPQQEYVDDAYKTQGWSEQKAKKLHKMIVKSALEQGKEVPTEILSEYPDLQKTVEPKGSRPEDFKTSEEYVASKVKELESSVKESGVDFRLHPRKNGDLRLDHISVPKGERGAGIGSSVMNKLTKFADDNGLRLVLNTAVKDDSFGTTSASRLKKFYKRFGFVENKGKDFSISENMFREPKSTKSQLTAEWQAAHSEKPAVEGKGKTGIETIRLTPNDNLESYKDAKGKTKYKKTIGTPLEISYDYGTQEKIHNGVRKATPIDVYEKEKADTLRIAKEKGYKVEISNDTSIRNPESGQISTDILTTPAEITKEVIHLLSPKTFVDAKALDEIYKAKGGKDKLEFELEAGMKDYRRMFDKASNEDNTAFIDRIKRGEKQPTPQMQGIADMMRDIEDAYYAEVQKLKPSATYLDNHYRVLWKTIPGSPEAQGFKGLFRRPLQGTKGFLKQHTLEDMSEGLAKGGVPYSYNPMVMWQHSMMDMQAFITANKMFNAMKDMNMVQFVKFGERAPEGFVKINDGIGRKYFPVDAGMVNAGEYYVESNVGRVLNNYLSTDRVRSSAIGSSLLKFKNLTTSLELSLSTFHAMYESGAAMATKIGLGLQDIVNEGNLLKGMKTLAMTATAPGEFTATGGRAVKFVSSPEEFVKTLEGQKFIKQFPNASELVNDAFMGGMKFAIHQDYKMNSMRALKDGIKAREPWAVAMNALPGLNEALMSPMFEYFIPRLKLGAFFNEMQHALDINKARLQDGRITRTTLARQVVDGVENRFGEMNFDNLFWDRNFKSAMQIVIRSVTWKVGALKNMAVAVPQQMAEIARAVKDGDRPNLDRNFAYLLGVGMLIATSSNILQRVAINKPPQDFKDLIAPRYNADGDRIMLNTHLKDWIHLLHNPTQFATSSAAGYIGKFVDIINNKDFYGTEIIHADDPDAKKAWDAVKFMFPAPFSLTQYQRISELQAPLPLKITTALGATQPAPGYISKTPAEQKASEILASKQEVGARTRAEFDKSKLKSGLRLRDEKSQDESEISSAVDNGQITRREAKYILKAADQTKLERMTTRMDADEVAHVIEKAGDKERDELLPIFEKKIKNKMKTANEEDATKLQTLYENVMKKYSKEK